MEETKQAVYHQVKVKCLNCSLHFILCTWYPEQHTANSITCPECKMQGNKIVWAEEVNGFVFEAVPGKAQILEMSMPR